MSFLQNIHRHNGRKDLYQSTSMQDAVISQMNPEAMQPSKDTGMSALDDLDASEQGTITWKETPPLNDSGAGRVQYCNPAGLCTKPKHSFS